MNFISQKLFLKLSALIVVMFLFAACKQEPQYHLKEPFGNNTMAANHEPELGPDIKRIPKKNFDRNKWEEKQRHRRAIKKVLKQAREWDPKYNR